MKNSVLFMLCGLLLAGSGFAASSQNAVCQNLKGMIQKQQNTLKHYQSVHTSSNVDLKQSRLRIAAYQKQVIASQQKIRQLDLQLADERQKLANIGKMISLEKTRQDRSTKNLSVVTQQVIYNERVLIDSLNKQYRDMCMKNTTAKTVAPKASSSSTQSGLAKQFYP